MNASVGPFDKRSSDIPGASGNSYWDYATRNDILPTVATANISGDINNGGANVANFNLGADWNGLP